MSYNDRIGALIIGSDFQALGAIRSLAQNNIPIFLLEYEIGISRFSRYVKRKKIDNSICSEKMFSESLIQLAKTENLKGWVIIPNDDEFVKMLSLAHEDLHEWYKISPPPWSVTQKFYYKYNSYNIAEELSIPIPKIYRSENYEDLVSQDLEFPLVLKPACKENYYTVTKKKAVKVSTLQELLKEYNEMTSIIGHADIVIQEMIETGIKGLYSYVSFFDGEKVVAGISAQRLRQHPMDFGHATTYAETVEVPELEVYATKFLQTIGYYGISEIEFIRDEKCGEYKFLEMNGRVWGWHTLAKAAGINLPNILFQHMTEGDIIFSKNFKKAKWVRLITDIPTFIQEFFGGRMKLREYLKSLKGKKEYAVFSFKDPIPFFMEFILVPYLWWRRGF